MGKLSSIEDVEARNRQTKPQVEPQKHVVEGSGGQQEQPRPQQPPRARSEAQAEEDFHGISTVEPLGAGHTALIVLAAIVTVAIVAYALNHWFHFI